MKKELPCGRSPQKIVGNSPAMRTVHDYIETAGGSNIPVLIIGESGVEKEWVARAIHDHSGRAGEFFLKIHGANLSEALGEGSLFGCEKGAFTGATALCRGSLEIADGGTIFLDEIGALAPVLQAKLVEFLKKRQFERIGGNTPIKVDVRVIAATSQNLEAWIRQGKFSADLFYQLNIFPICVPPLRERKTDIIPLADYFMEKYNQEMGKNVTGISSAAVDMLMHYHWPGNVQELENCLERALLLSTDHLIHRHHLPPSLRGSAS